MRRSYSLIFVILLASTHATERARRSYLGGRGLGFRGSFGFGSGSDGGEFRGGFGGGLDTVHRGIHGILNKVHEKFSHLGEAVIDGIGGGLGGGVDGSKNSGQSYGSGSSSGDIRGDSGSQGTVNGGSGVFQTRVTGDFGGRNVYAGSGSQGTNHRGSGVFQTGLTGDFGGGNVYDQGHDLGSGFNVGLGGPSSSGGNIGSSGAIQTGELVLGSDNAFGGGVLGDSDHGNSIGSTSTNENTSHESGGAVVISESGSKDVHEGVSNSGSLSSGFVSLGFGHGGSGQLVTGSGGSFKGGIVGDQIYGHDKKSTSDKEKENHGSVGAFFNSDSGSNIDFEGSSNLGSATGSSGYIYTEQEGSRGSKLGSSSGFGVGIIGGQHHGHGKESGSGPKVIHGGGSALDSLSGSSVDLGIGHGVSGGLVAGSGSSFGGSTFGSQSHGHSIGSASANENESLENGGAFVINGGATKVIHEVIGSSGSLGGGSVSLGIGHGGSRELVTGSGGSFEGGTVGGQVYGHDKKSTSDKQKGNHGSVGAFFNSGSGSNTDFEGSSSLGSAIGSSGYIYTEQEGSGESKLGLSSGFGVGIIGGQHHEHGKESAIGSKVIHGGGSALGILSGSSVDLGIGHGVSGKLAAGSGSSSGPSTFGSQSHGHSIGSASANENESLESGGAFVINGGSSKVIHDGIGSSGSLGGGSVSLGFGHGGSRESVTGSGGSFEGSIVGGQVYGHDKKSTSNKEKGNHGSGGAFFNSGSGSNIDFGGSSSLGSAIGSSGYIYTEQEGSAGSKLGSSSGFGVGIIGGQHHEHGKESAIGSKVIHGGGSALGILSGSSVDLGIGHEVSGELAAGSGSSSGASTFGSQSHGHSIGSASANENESFESGGAFVINGGSSKVIHDGIGSSGSLGGGSVSLGFGHGGSRESVTGSGGSFEGGIVGGQVYGHDKKSTSNKEKGNHGSGGALFNSGSGSNTDFEGSSSLGSAIGSSGYIYTEQKGSGKSKLGSSSGYGVGIIGGQHHGHGKESASGSKVIHGGGSALGNLSGSSVDLGIDHGVSGELASGSGSSFGASAFGSQSHGHSIGPASANENESLETGGAFVINGGGSKVIHEGIDSSGSLGGGSVSLGFGHGGSRKSVTGSGGSLEGGIVGGQVYEHDKKSTSDKGKGNHGSVGSFFNRGSGSNIDLGGSSNLGSATGSSGCIYTEQGGSGVSKVVSSSGFGGGFIAGKHHGHGKESASGSKVVHGGGSVLDSLSGGSVGLVIGHGVSGQLAAESGSSFGGSTFGSQSHGHSLGSASANENESLVSEGAFVINGSESKVIHEGVGSSGSLGGGSVSLGFGHGGSKELVTGSSGSFEGGIVGGQVYGHDKESASGKEKGSQGNGGAFVISGSGFNVGHGGSSSLGGDIGSSGAIHTGEFVLGSGTGFGGGIVGDLNHRYSMGSLSANENKNLESEGAVVISGGGTKVVHEDVSSTSSLSGGSVSLGFSDGGSGESVTGSGSSFEGGIVGGQVYGHDKESASGKEKGSQGNGGAFVISDSGFNVGLVGTSNLGGSIGGSGAINVVESVLGSNTDFGGGSVGDLDHRLSVRPTGANENKSLESEEAVVISGGGTKVVHEDVSSTSSLSGGSVSLGFSDGVSGESVTGSGSSFEGGIFGGQVYGHDKESASGKEKGSQGNGGAFVISGSGFNVGHGGSSSLGGDIGSSGAIHTGEFVLGSGTGFGGGIGGDLNHRHSMGSLSANENKNLESGGAVVISGGGTKVVHEDVSSTSSLSGGSVSLGFSDGGSGESVTGSGSSFEGGIVGGQVYGHDKESASGKEKGSQGNGGAFVISGSGFNVGLGGTSNLGGSIGGSGAIHVVESVLGSNTDFGGGSVGDLDHRLSVRPTGANENASHESGGAVVISGGGSKVVHEDISSTGIQSGGLVSLGFGHGVSGESVTGSSSSFKGDIVGDQVYGYNKESTSGNENGSQGSGGALVISGSGFNVGHVGSSSLGGNIGSSGAIHTGEFILGSGTGFGGRVVGNSDHGHSKGSASANKKGSHSNEGSFIVSGSGSRNNHAEISSLGSASSGSADLTPGHEISGESGTGSSGSFGDSIVGNLGSVHRGRWSNGGGFGKYRGESGYGGTHGSFGHHGFHGEKWHGYSGFGSVGGGIGGEHGSGYGAKYRGHSGHRW